MTQKYIKMEVQIPVKFRAGNQVVPEGPQTQKRHQKVVRKAGKKAPGPQTIWNKSALGIAMGFVFLKIYSSNFLSRHEARCDSKPACKENLSCQSYLCLVSGFAAVDQDDKSTQLSNKLEGTKAHSLNDCPNTCERDLFYSLLKGSLNPCRVH